MPAPKKTYAVLGTLLVAFWFLSGIGQDAGDSEAASNVGTAFWISFGVTILVTLAYSLALGVRALARRRSSTA